MTINTQECTLGVDLGIKGRVALVTGGSRGIGRAIAEKLAEVGVGLGINYIKSEGSALDIVRRAEAQGVRAVAIKGDVSNAVEAERAVHVMVEEFGHLDILICNAGIWEGAGLEEQSEESWDRVISTNLKGTWATCRAAVPLMKKRGWGRIVIVSSTAGQRGEAYYSGYAASKGGLIAFTKSIAVELAPYGVNVNAVAPGWVETDMTQDVLLGESSREEIQRTIPLGHIASPDDVALPILFLCSDWSRHITGEVLNINGGSVLCG